MLETLVAVLKWDIPSPEISLAPDGDICLDWPELGAYAMISTTGAINWAMRSGQHGSDFDQFKQALEPTT